MNLAVWLILCAIWGTTWIFIKVGLDEGLPPVTFAAARFSLAAVVIGVIIRWKRIPLPNTRSQWRLMLVTGLLQFTVNYSLVFWAETRITSGLASVLQGMISVFGLGLAWYYLPTERINGVKVLAVLLGFAGVGVIFGDQLQMRNFSEFAGSAGIVVGAYAAAHASILVKAKAGGIHPASLVFSQMVCGGPPLIAYALLFEGDPRGHEWSWLAVVCVLQLSILGTVTAFWLYYWLLSRIESTKAMMLSLVTPIIAVCVGAVVLGEKLPALILVGGAMILGGIGLILVRAGSPKARGDAPEIHQTV
jgi:drug/metabolite transporter (DMT)-like permease